MKSMYFSSDEIVTDYGAMCLVTYSLLCIPLGFVWEFFFFRIYFSFNYLYMCVPAYMCVQVLTEAREAL